MVNDFILVKLLGKVAWVLQEWIIFVEFLPSSFKILLLLNVLVVLFKITCLFLLLDRKTCLAADCLGGKSENYLLEFEFVLVMFEYNSVC